jgi:hypothetical protein
VRGTSVSLLRVLVTWLAAERGVGSVMGLYERDRSTPPGGRASPAGVQLGQRICFGSSPKKARCRAAFPQDRRHRSPPNQVVSWSGSR